MVKDAYYFLIPLLLAATATAFFFWPLSLLFLLLACFVAFFFRDPERAIPDDPTAIVSPADGKVIRLDETADGATRLSIFLSVFDVHVNRAPIDGEVSRQEHRPGKFLLAFDERASLENEQLQMTLKGDREISFSLIAGLVARRIVPWTRPGDRVAKGDRIGLIRFGSRVDILIPPGCRLNVQKGDRVRGGASVLAYWDGDS